MSQSTEPTSNLRKMAYGFLNNPMAVQINIARKIGLLREDDPELNAAEFTKMIFARAKTAGKLGDLWAEIEMSIPMNSDEPTTEPVSSVPGSYPDGIYGEAQPPEPVSPSAEQVQAALARFQGDIQIGILFGDLRKDIELLIAALADKERELDAVKRESAARLQEISGVINERFAVNQRFNILNQNLDESVRRMHVAEAENARLSAALAEKDARGTELEVKLLAEENYGAHKNETAKMFADRLEEKQTELDDLRKNYEFNQAALAKLGLHNRKLTNQLASQQQALVEKEKELDAAKEECLEYNHACVHLDKFVPWAGVSNPERIKNVAAMFAAQQEALVAARDVMTRALPTIDSRITDYADEYRAVLARVNACLPEGTK